MNAAAAQLDDFSDEGGSPSGRNKRVQANRLSAQRSRQRKLQKEADLRQEVDELNREISQHDAEEKRLQAWEQSEPSTWRCHNLSVPPPDHTT